MSDIAISVKVFIQKIILLKQSINNLLFCEENINLLQLEHSNNPSLQVLQKEKKKNKSMKRNIQFFSSR